MNADFHRIENNVAAEFDERQRIYLHEFSVESAQALDAQRQVLAHDETEEIRRRDCKTLGMMQTLEFESHSEASAQREGFEQTLGIFFRRSVQILPLKNAEKKCLNSFH